MKSIFFNKTLLLFAAIILTTYADIQAQTFNTGNVLAGSRLRLQGDMDRDAKWQRGMVSQNIYYDLTTDEWTVYPGNVNYNDFAMMKFSNNGVIDFYTRRVDMSKSNAFDNTTLENTYKRMTILHNGNVGIGTATPDNELDVSGTIRAKEIVVEEGWSDYVFYDDYQLATLEEEEIHIEENGHLLGFESEEDMAGEIQLGDVSKRQQAKIEEMMLHLINMNKQLATMQTKIEHLEKENARLKK